MTLIGTPRKVIEHTEWVVAGNPQMCIACKHLHYPRVPEPNFANRAPQWSFCEDAVCGCNMLHAGVRR